MIKPLDFVRIKNSVGKYYESCEKHVGLVTEVNSVDGSCSVEWLEDGGKYLRNAWWGEDELVKIDSLPNLLTRKLAHPLGRNAKNADEFYERR